MFCPPVLFIRPMWMCCFFSNSLLSIIYKYSVIGFFLMCICCILIQFLVMSEGAETVFAIQQLFCTTCTSFVGEMWNMQFFFKIFFRNISREYLDRTILSICAGLSAEKPLSGSSITSSWTRWCEELPEGFPPHSPCFDCVLCVFTACFRLFVKVLGVCSCWIEAQREKLPHHQDSEVKCLISQPNMDIWCSYLQEIFVYSIYPKTDERGLFCLTEWISDPCGDKTKIVKCTGKHSNFSVWTSMYVDINAVFNQTKDQIYCTTSLCLLDVRMYFAVCPD